MSGPMFDLEGCDDAVLIDNKTASTRFIKAKNCPRIHLEGNEAAQNALSEIGIPVDALSEEQINCIISKVVDEKGSFSNSNNDWLSNTATFATLASDVKATILGALIATGVSCYQKVKKAIK